jgi:short-subunit dehydrogenase
MAETSSLPEAPATPGGAPARLVSMRVLALGATSAIAEATLRLLAERGASFFLVGRHPQKVGAVRDDLLTRGAARATAFVADLDDTGEHPALLAHAATELGGIDVALLAHGVLGDQAEAEKDFTAAAAVLRTNFLSAVSLVGWLANYFEAERRGTIAVISSVAGDRGRKSNYVYGSSKGGLNVFLEGVRNRIDRAGVQVLTIKPGFVATPMTAHLPQNALFAQPGQVARHIVRAIDKRRDVVYVPPFWGPIMLVVRSIPRRIFKRMDL